MYLYFGIVQKRFQWNFSFFAFALIRKVVVFFFLESLQAFNFGNKASRVSVGRGSKFEMGGMTFFFSNASLFSCRMFKNVTAIQ